MDRVKISTQDALWLTMDRPNNLMIIDGVMWFRDVPDWDAVESTIRERLVERYPVFRCRAVQRDGGWAWEDDPNFRLDSVIHRVELPGAGGRDELQTFVAAQRSVPLPKDRPMWTMFLISNVGNADGTAGGAVLGRFHHSIADGIRLTQVFMGLCDLDEDAGPTAVGKNLRRSTTPTAIAVSTVRNVAASITDSAGAAVATGSALAGSAAAVALAAATGDVSAAAATVVGGSTNIFSKGIGAFKHPERLMDVSHLVSSPDNRVVNDMAAVGTLALAPPSISTVWSGKPSVEKGVSWVPMIPLAQVKEIGKATGTTVNDVVISVVAGALDRYLRGHGDTSVDELLWLVPVSIKPISMEIVTELGNFFAMVALRMPMGIDDVGGRLALMHQNMDRIKNSDEALLTFGIQRGVSAAPDRIAAGLTNFFANKAVGVLTNVPGPRVPMRLAGTEVEGILGWAPCSGDEPITIAILSYNGKVTIGFAADRKLVPDVDQLAALFEVEFAHMYDEVIGGIS